MGLLDSIRSKMNGTHTNGHTNGHSKKVVVVFGATGKQGGSVIKSVLGDPKAAAQFSIRAITRDPSKPSAQQLIEQGCECVSVSHSMSLSDGGISSRGADSLLLPSRPTQKTRSRSVALSRAHTPSSRSPTSGKR
jgi:hypothetical protein